MRCDLSRTSRDQGLREAVYYSVGGGDVIQEGEPAAPPAAEVPYPFDTAAQLMAHCGQQACVISEIAFRNEADLAV